MKKLMTALLCAVGFSLVSQAEKISGTNFEALEVDAKVVGKTDAGQEGQGYWGGEGVDALIATNTFTAVEVQPGEGEPQIEYVPNIAPYTGAVGYPTVHDEAQTSEKFLSINTKGGELVRNIQEGGTEQSIGDGIYFDSMVQFTATDALDANAGSESDKLILWLRDNGDGTTNLVVNAGYLDDAGDARSTNYVVTSEVQADKWYRLTIQAIDGVISDGDDDYVGYAIYIDGVKAEYSTDVVAFDDSNWPYEVDAKYSYLYNENVHALFPSLLGKSNLAKKFTSVAFSGVGAVDDIEFTTEPPEFIGPEKEWVAQIGTQGYETLAEALEEAQANDTITLLADVELTERLFVNAGAVSPSGRYATTSENKTLTIDLNGFNISSTSNIALAGGSLTITGNGTIATTASGLAPIEIRGTGDLSAKRTLVIGSGVTLSGECYGLNVFGSNDNKLNKIDVTVNGTIKGMLFVLGNLKNINNEISIVVNGEVDASKAVGQEKVHTGIAIAGYADVTIGTNAKVSGESGIEVRAGTLTVNGGTITATAETYGYEPNSNGTTTKGAAIAVAQHTTKLATAATLNGGTLSGVKDLAVINVNNDMTDVTVSATASYTSSALIPEGYKWVATETQGVYELKEIVYATVTIETVANCTITVKNGNDNVVTGARFDVDDAVKLTVTRVAAEGYKLKDCAAEETVSVIGNVTITAVVEEDASNLDPEKGSTSVPVKAESENAAVAVAKSGITVPAGATVEKAAYAEYFNYSVSGENGEYTVTINGIKETVEASVAESAVERLTNDEATAIEVPAGLYYKITPSTGLPIDGEPQSGLSTGGSVTIGKPGTGTGFYKIELSPTAFPAQNN